MRILIMSFLLSVTTAVIAQQYGFEQWSPEDGLAQSQVRRLALDRDGRLWIATIGGASVFDGRSFTNHGVQQGLPEAQVGAMLAASDGSMWLAAGASLVRVKGLLHERIDLPEEVDGARIEALAFDASGRMLIATDGAGVRTYANGVFGMLEGYPTDTARSARTLLLLADGSVYIGLRDGLLLWKAGHCVEVALGDPAPKNVSSTVLAHDGSVWVSTYGDGVYRIGTDGRMNVFTEEEGLLQDNVRSVTVDALGRIWASTKFGLNRLDPVVADSFRVRSFTVHQGLPNDNVYCTLEDGHGQLWIGTDGGGLLRFAGDRFVTYTVKDGLCSDLVMTISADKNGDLWLGTYGSGVCRWDGMAMITTLEGLPNNTVWCSLLDRSGRHWFGTSSGLCRIEDGAVVLPDSDAALVDMRVLSLLQDAKGNIWCGTREGVSVIDSTGDVVHHRSGGRGPGSSVRSMIQDREGTIWLGSDDGLFAARNGLFTRYSTTDGICDNTVLSLTMDGDGRIWIGTANGITIKDGNTFTSLRLGEDPGSNYVDLLFVDGNGTGWAGTNNGIYRFRPRLLPQQTASIEHINTRDGLLGTECNLNAGYLDAYDRMWIGTASGLVMHDHRRAANPPYTTLPTCSISGIRSFLQPSEWKGQCDSLDRVTGLPVGLHLDHRKHYLTFDYTGVALHDPEAIRFRYMLAGYDADWLPETEARFASYSNLPHGEYTFMAAVRYGQGAWSPSATFQFVILPPFWLTWWFVALCVLAAGGSLFGIMRWRAAIRARSEKTRQLLLRSRMLQLEQQALNANMNRHFVFNALNSIQYYINRQDRTAANKYLTSFAKLIRKNLDASQSDTVTLAEELERLELYLTLEHMRFKDKFRYSVEIDERVDTSNVHLPAMMLQPYVENSIWHGILPMDRQGAVLIRVQTGEEGRVKVTIADDGIGVQESLKGKGNGTEDHISRGIEITKGRADVLRSLHLSDIRISGPEQSHDPAGQVTGTKVDIELPLGNGGKKVANGLNTPERAYTFDVS
ncbi:MAG: histidine kinase [Flavobacteriales bacterium]|nr:histidine kinase [Flavobacteriales bacterium]